ncbi:MAG TPA: DUF1570 domain-containing protein, partial [Planctomycetota bacterium]|nr:DUF1570 domain-containing protein [Planctomycetota bacterium]
DPLFTRRAALMVQFSKQLFELCQKLYDAGHTERALGILNGIEPIATGATKKSIAELTAKIRAAGEEVDLDKDKGEGSDDAKGAFVKIEGKRYLLDSSLDPKTTQRVADLMDDIFNYYVRVYFDDDVTRVGSVKPTIKILPTHAEMMKLWPGEQRPGIGGWWSPGENTVVCYDTTTSTGSTDQMLQTLYHEASHHFMTMLARGGHTPAWINEGTASFFEGAKAMNDRTVLWPYAAEGRLGMLQRQLTGGYPGPSVSQVLSFNAPGSYPGEYYSYGWGLVYFLLQYEDPETFEYVFRPLYSSYRETIAKKGGDPMALFKEVLLAPSAPGGITDLDKWSARWREWILNQVYPLHNLNNPSRTRELRLERATRYVAAADAAKASKSPPKVSEVELMTRALGDLQFIRKDIDGETKLDPDLVVMQADVLERMGRPQNTAALIEEVLDRADDEEGLLEQERYDELEKRLTKLDAKNQALRLANTRSKNFAKMALKLLEEYQKSESPMTLTAFEASQQFASALESKPLAELAENLRVKARDAGLLRGALYKIGGRASAWATIFDGAEDNFDPGESKIGIGGVRPVGRIYTGVPVSGEYEVRCTLGRVGEVSLTSFNGIVFSGTPTTPWYSVGIDGRSQLIVYRHAKGGSELKLKSTKLNPVVAKDESPTFSVHVYRENRLIVKVGSRDPVEITLDEPLPKSAFVGLLTKNGRTELTDTVLEIFP